MGGWCGILGRILGILTCFDSREGGEIMPKQLSTDSQRILKRNLKRFLEDSQGILKGFSRDSQGILKGFSDFLSGFG